MSSLPIVRIFNIHSHSNCLLKLWQFPHSRLPLGHSYLGMLAAAWDASIVISKRISSLDPSISTGIRIIERVLQVQISTELMARDFRAAAGECKAGEHKACAHKAGESRGWTGFTKTPELANCSIHSSCMSHTPAAGCTTHSAAFLCKGVRNNFRRGTVRQSPTVGNAKIRQQRCYSKIPQNSNNQVMCLWTWDYNIRKSGYYIICSVVVTACSWMSRNSCYMCVHTVCTISIHIRTSRKRDRIVKICPLTNADIFGSIRYLWWDYHIFRVLGPSHYTYATAMLRRQIPPASGASGRGSTSIYVLDAP